MLPVGRPVPGGDVWFQPQNDATVSTTGQIRPGQQFRLWPFGPDRGVERSRLGVFLFGVPIIGNLAVLAGLSTLFIASNLATGYTFSTVAQNQLQAMQMTLMYFLPNILLSGFMFPFAGMPVWAQWVGEAMPLTHYLRIVRSIMLKGSSVADLHYDALAMFVLMLLTMGLAIMRFRRTLD